MGAMIMNDESTDELLSGAFVVVICLTSKAPYKACSGFTFVTAHRIAQQPKAAFVAGRQPVTRPSRLPASGPIDNYPGETLPH